MQTNSTLFQRLGGSGGIASIVDDIVTAHMENPGIRARFLPFCDDPARIAAIKKQVAAFFEAGSGGPASYGGRSMREAHRGMNVNAAEYLAAVDDILLVLRKHQVDEQTQKDVLAIAYSLKGEILHM
ncbi:MAG: group 1 truncated hemoglobin [Kofleriaceae bacterium]